MAIIDYIQNIKKNITFLEVINSYIFGNANIDEYNPGKTYSNTDMIIKFDSTTRQLDILLCNTNGTTGIFDISKWTATSVSEVLNNSNFATKPYVDGLVQGIRDRTQVKMATTGPITLSGTQTIDSIVGLVNDKVLVKDQTNATENGIWDMASGTWTRDPEYDTPSELSSSVFVFVQQGSTQHDTGWVKSSDTVTVIGTDPIIFTQFSSVGVIDGDNITTVKAGTVLSLKSGIVAPDIYRSVQVDAYGRVTAGFKPTTIADYGLTDAAPINSPPFTGIPQTPTAPIDTNTPQIASTGFVINQSYLKQPGINWNSRTNAVDNQWLSVTYANGLFVAVSSDGAGNRVMTSPDGVNWTSRTSAADNNWSAITYANGLFIAVSSDGTGNRVMTSADGINWTIRTSAVDNSWRSVTYGNGLFVAVSSDGTGNRVMTSPDGINWTIGTSAADNQWRSVTYGNGLFVAVSYDGTGNRVMTSPDGINWTIGTSAADNGWISVTYGNGLFVAVAQNGTGNRVMTSPDGITWTSRTSAADNNWNSVTYGNGLFVAVSLDGTGNRVMTSPDGITWTSRVSAVNNQWRSVIYGNGIFVAVSNTGTGNRVMTSGMALDLSRKANLDSPSFTGIPTVPTTPIDTNTPQIASTGFVINQSYLKQPGINWTSRTNAIDNNWLSVTYGNGLFVAVSNTGTGNRVMTSPDGINWTSRTSAADNNWSAITYANGLFVAVSSDGTGNRVMTSPDGINWTSRTSAADNQWRSVTYGNGLFVAIAVSGTGNRVMTSPDGINWTIRTSAVDNAWYGITYGNGLFVAVSTNGTGNRVMTSPDGINWTSRTSAADNNWDSVTYGNGLFVAVATSGTGNRVMTSLDGIIWTIRTSAADNQWLSVIYGNGLFVAVAYNGTGNRVMTSPDGVTWTIRTSAADNAWYGIAYANGLFVGVSNSGTGNRVMTSGMALDLSAKANLDSPLFTGVPTAPTAVAGTNTAQLATTWYVDREVNTSPVPTPLNPVYGLQVAPALKAAPYKVVNIQGRTLVNLLGRDGNCEDISKWNTFQSSFALDSTNYVYGSNSIKITATAATNNQLAHPAPSSVINSSTAYYVILAQVKNGTMAGTADMSFSDAPVANITLDTTKFNLVWAKSTGDVLTGKNMQIRFFGNAVGQYAYIDGYRVYQISVAEYAALGTTLTDPTVITSKYPYVDDVKHVNGTYITRYGENLLPTFNEWTNQNVGTLAITDPYAATLTTTATFQFFYIDVPIIGGAPYTFSKSGNALIAIDGFDANKNSIGNLLAYSANLSFTVTAQSNAAYLRIYVGNGSSAAGTYTINNPRLNIGAVDKGFKPRNDDYLYFSNTTIANSVDGTVFDQIYHKEGRFFRENRFVRDMLLDGSLAWTFLSDGSGYKCVKLPLSPLPVKDTGALVKYDGKIVQRLSQGGSGFTSYDQQLVLDSADPGGYYNNTLISIADTDSGWGETYTPTAGEIQAYFWGWLMYATDINPTAPYASGTKAWKWRDGTHGVTVLPTTLAPNGFTPYKLTYQLATSTLEEIAFEGSVSTLEGSNQFEVGNGMIVREKANPYYYSATANYLINNNSAFPASDFKFRSLKIISVYENGREFKKWTREVGTGSPYGIDSIVISAANFNTTAVYEVTYIALDQYALTSNVQTINGEYNANVKTIVDRLSQDVSDVSTRTSVVETLSQRLYSTLQQSVRDTTLYVSTTGSDSGDGSAAKPFKTITKAILMIPQVVNHAYVINVAAGTYAEDVAFTGFIGSGTIKLAGAGAVLSDNYVVSSIFVRYCSVQVLAQGFKSSTTGNAFGGAVSSNIIFDYCKTDVSALGAYGCRFDSCTATVSNCLISNRYATIDAEGNSKVYSNNNSGTGNTYGLASHSGSSIGTLGAQSSATTQTLADSGGLITGGVSNPWGDNNSTVIKATNGYEKLPNGMIKQWGQYVNVPPGSGITIAFPITYPNACLSLSLVPWAGSPTTTAVTGILPNQFNATHGAAAQISMFWMSIGY